MDVADFLDFLFGEEKGWFYAPYKNGLGFHKQWYLWPTDKDFYIEELGRLKETDSFLNPVLYNSCDLNDFKLSRVVWCDFDEGIPDELGDFPRPAIQVRSSDNPTKQHWYWRVSHSISSTETLERYNRQLAYALGADKGCWNVGRVLRPINTLNHKYNPPRPVSLETYRDETIDSFVFAALPEVDKLTEDEWQWDESKLEPVSLINTRYVWPTKAYDFFSTPKWDGERHHALTSVAHTCQEIGMTKDECLSVLWDADTRWRKYTGRSDRITRLKAIVEYAYPVEESLAPDHNDSKQDRPDFGRPKSFSRFTQYQYQVDWIIEGLLHNQGLAIVASPPGIGKTQFTTNLLLSCGSGRSFLGWEIVKPRKVLFLSLEMTQPELKFYLDKMIETYTEEERKLIDTNCFFVSRQAFRLNQESNQRSLLQWIDELQPEGIFIDSLSRCTGGDLEKGEIDQVFDFLNREVRDKRKCFVWFVHHNRKANFNQKQPKKLEDLYGSQYIGAYASTVLGLWRVSNQELEVNCLKVWLSKPFKSFLIDRTPNLTFTKQKSIEY